MKTLLLNADDLLRGQQAAAPARRRELLAILIAFGFSYGVAMGCFGGVAHGRWLQMLYSGVKVPMLLLVTFGLSLPSFFVLNTVLGVRNDFGDVLRALVASQAALTIVLASFAPLTLLWYASASDYDAAILFNTVMFGAASFAAQWMLRRLYQPLVQRNSRHRMLLRGWLLIYAFVGIQLGWVLRPFVGNPASDPQFFRQDMWGNAYVVVIQKVVQLHR